MKNTLTDLNNHLFMAMERLNDEDLSGDELRDEIERSRAISNIAHGIIDNAGLALRAAKFNDEKMNPSSTMPKMLN